MKKNVCLFIVLSFCFYSFSQINIFPSNWWVGMKHNNVQLLLQAKEGKSFGDDIILITRYKGVVVTKTTHLENKRYLLVNLVINENAKAVGRPRGKTEKTAERWAGQPVDRTRSKQLRRQPRPTPLARGRRSHRKVRSRNPSGMGNADPQQRPGHPGR